MEQNVIHLSHGDIVYLQGGSGPLVLFLHGGVATSHAYLPLLMQLSHNHSILAPVHPGHGQSFSIDKDWTLSDFILTYKELLRRLGVEPEILIGHSFGGTLALLLAAGGIGQQAVVLDCPGLPFPFSPKDYIRIMIEEAKDVLRQQPDVERVGELVGAAGTLAHTLLRHPDDVPWLYRTVPAMDITGELKTIQIPVTIFWGEQDSIVPKQIGEKMSRVIPSCSFMVFPCYGHNYPVTAHEFTYQELVKVLRL